MEDVAVQVAHCSLALARPPAYSISAVGLEGDVPDHSTFSKNRHGRFRDSDLLRELFETTVRRCIAEGLVPGSFSAKCDLELFVGMSSC
jgi:hypothetical protein